MAVTNTSADIQPVIAESRLIAISYGHEYIHTDHLFVAMLRRNCLASQFLGAVDADACEQATRQLHPVTSRYREQDTLPLTQEAERVIGHAARIAQAMAENTFNSVHVLLAFVLYDNPIKFTIEQAGWVVDHIVQQYANRPDPFVPPAPPLVPPNSVSRIVWALTSKEQKHKHLSALYDHVLLLKSYDALEDCIQVCRTALSLNPGDVNFMWMLAYSLYKTNDYSGLSPLLDQLLTTPSYRKAALYLQAELKAVQGDRTSLITLLKQLLEDTPDNVNYLNNLGLCLSQEQEFSSAVPYLEKAVQLNPKHANAHCNLGYALFKLGDKEAGIAAINRSLSLNKSNSYAYWHLGVIYLDSGDKETARENLQLALKYKYTERYGDEALKLLEQIDSH
jgi:tetratricopeptide (TPR) repeat protein